MQSFSTLPSAGRWGQPITVGSVANSIPIITYPEAWVIYLNPATATQATISKAAAAAGFKHILIGIYAKYLAGASAITAAAPMTLNVRDGATGAGTILFAVPANVPATAAQEAPPISMNNLNIPGTAATAMTIEFAAAGGTNSYQMVMAWGITVAA